MQMETVEVTMTFTARVKAGYTPHDLADAVRFHVGLSELDAMEADISAIQITDAREAHPTVVNLDTPQAVEEWLDS